MAEKKHIYLVNVSIIFLINFFVPILFYNHFKSLNIFIINIYKKQLWGYKYYSIISFYYEGDGKGIDYP